ncbi:MAG: 4'-phosphopantetheinyl transferase superfamily protein [Candidatus Lindowbacteria bacterium]|nr:4'-phosphopantetheinyl transferase superfamily protein [Candidatus Lindowbacteria bacterium]
MISISHPFLLDRNGQTENSGLAFVFRGSDSPLPTEIDQFLHPQEQSLYSNALVSKRQNDFLGGRYAAKKALAEVIPHLVPNQILISSGVFGQPCLEIPHDSLLEVSIAHSDALSAAMVGPRRHPLGIDIEVINPDKQKTLASQVTEEELLLFENFEMTDIERLTRIWATKEALSKALRTGMTCPFEILSIRSAEPDPSSPLITGRFHNFSQYTFHSWAVETFAFSLALPFRTTLKFDTAPHTMINQLLAERDGSSK